MWGHTIIEGWGCGALLHDTNDAYVPVRLRVVYSFIDYPSQSNCFILPIHLENMNLTDPSILSAITC